MGQAMASGIMELIDQLYASISDAKRFPLAGDRCVIDRDNALDLLDEIRTQLPAEVAEAKRLLSAKAEVIRKTNEEAEQIHRDAEDEAARLVEQDNITIAAQQRAQEVIAAAEQKAEDLRRASNGYANEMLRRAEDTLAQALDSVRRSRSAFEEVSGSAEE